MKDETKGALMICAVIAFIGCCLILIISFGIDNNKYNDDCKIFIEEFDQVPYVDCKQYLRNFPNMTGQEMIDYHETREERLLNEKVQMQRLNINETKHSIAYKYKGFDADCFVFLYKLQDIYETDLSRVECIDYLKYDETLTGQEMIDLHEKRQQEEKQDLLEKPVYMR